MKRLLALAWAIALAWSVAAIPDDIAIAGGADTYAPAPAIEIVDLGTGDVATVIVARKDDFAPWADMLLSALDSTPRLLAVLLEDGQFESMAGTDAFPALLDGILRGKGIALSCIVTCGDCAVEAASAAGRLDTLAGIVLLDIGKPIALDTVVPTLIVRDFGSSLRAATEKALGLDRETMRRLRMEAKLVPVIP